MTKGEAGSDALRARGDMTGSYPEAKSPREATKGTLSTETDSIVMLGLKFDGTRSAGMVAFWLGLKRMTLGMTCEGLFFRRLVLAPPTD